MDNGIWAIWYDLPENVREEHIRWLHNSYLPEIISRPGFAWAAHYQSNGGGPDMEKVRNTFPKSANMENIGNGTQFLMLGGATTPSVFFTAQVVNLENTQERIAREMINQREGVRTCIFSEFARVNGPEIETRPTGTTPGPAIQMGSFRINEIDKEFDLGSWYTQDRLPAMAKMSGCIGARVMLSVAGWAKYSVLYEFTSLEARLENFEKQQESLMLNEKEWSGKVIRSTMHSPGSPTVAQRIWPL